jgi:hypothetical protein
VQNTAICDQTLNHLVQLMRDKVIAIFQVDACVQNLRKGKRDSKDLAQWENWKLAGIFMTD